MQALFTPFTAYILVFDSALLTSDHHEFDVIDGKEKIDFVKLFNLFDIMFFKRSFWNALFSLH